MIEGLERTHFGPNVAATIFHSTRGVPEAWLLAELHDDAKLNFEETVELLHHEYLNAVDRANLGPETVVHTRFFCSDAANQAADLKTSGAWKFASAGTVSIVEQTPLSSPGKLCILAYHIGRKSFAPEKNRQRSNGDGVFFADEFRLNNYSILFSRVLPEAGGAAEQTGSALRRWLGDMSERGLNLRDNAIRTWIYLTDIDRDYQEMISARSAAYHEAGGNGSLRFPASTGIEGRSETAAGRIALEAMTVRRIAGAAGAAGPVIARMDAPGYMGSACDYGATFERGTTVTYGDRRHFFISGTASIDEHGNVLHPGDATAQTRRVIANIRALLAGAGATLDDIAVFTAYVRDDKDYENVRSELVHLLPVGSLVHLTRGRVCRPEWLVEVEAVGVRSGAAPCPVFS